jgi:hypothetical protein
MGKVYVGQTAFTLQLITGIDLTEAETVEIKYQKPDGTVDSWDAEVLDTINGIIQYKTTEETDLDQAGAWHFWAYITFADSTVAPGEPKRLTIYNEIGEV